MATVTLRIGPVDHGRRMTLEEFDEAEEEGGYRYELARGVLEVSEVPGDPHGLIVCYFYNLLAAYWQQHPGLIYRYGGAGEFRVYMPEMVSARHPDVCVALMATPRDGRGRRPPSLVVEVVSEGAEARRRDYETKREEYLAFGLREYWIVDRAWRRVTVLVREEGGWFERVFEGDQTASGGVLPGFVVPLADLWAIPPDEEAQG